jgi:hypothetical protein
MSHDTLSNFRTQAIEHVPEISRLSKHEADRLLVQAEQARLAEIDRYWALCQTDPDQAAGLAAGTAPIVSDIFHLARNVLPLPAPSSIPGLSKATRRLLAVKAIRESLDDTVPAPADPVDAFWDDSQVVGLKRVNEEQVVVLRYDGPLFNPGMVPESEVSGEGYWFLVCHRESIGDAGEFEYLMAYVIGAVAEDGKWKAVHIDLASRSDLMRDMPAMETLVDRGQLSGELFDTRPLPTFPSASNSLIDQLQAHKAALLSTKE